MNADLKAEMAADAQSIVDEIGRTVVFKKKAQLGETTATVAVQAVISDPTLSQELVAGGVADIITFEVQVLVSTTLPANWLPLSNIDAWMGRHLTVQGYDRDLRVVDYSKMQDSAWAVFRVQASNA